MRALDQDRLDRVNPKVSRGRHLPSLLLIVPPSPEGASPPLSPESFTELPLSIALEDACSLWPSVAASVTVFSCGVGITSRLLFAHVPYAVNITVLAVSISVSSKESRRSANAEGSTVRSLRRGSDVCAFDPCTIYNLRPVLNRLMYSVTHTLMTLAGQATRVGRNF